MSALRRYTELARLRRIAVGCPDHNLVHTHNLVRQPMCVVRVLIIAMRVLVRQEPMCYDRAAVVSQPAALRRRRPTLHKLDMQEISVCAARVLLVAGARPLCSEQVRIFRVRSPRAKKHSSFFI